MCRATFTEDHGAVKVRIDCQKPLMIDAGQSINLSIPSVSFFWSFLQTYTFMVVSWAAAKQHTIDLLVEPQRGLTRELLYHLKKRHNMNLLVIFNGPHGISIKWMGIRVS